MIAALYACLLTAHKKREKTPDLTQSDFTRDGSKTTVHVREGYWACHYLTKDDEIALFEKIKENYAESHKKKYTPEDLEEARLALAKYKPASTWLPFYSSKFFVFATSLGSGFCGAMITKFLATGWGWPILLVSAAAALVFVAQFFLGLALNRSSIPKNVVNLLQNGITPIPSSSGIKWPNVKTYLPLIFAIGSASQIATFTYVSTHNILISSQILGASAVSLLGPIAACIAICSAITYCCMLFNSSQTIYRAPKAWANQQRRKLTESLEQGEKKVLTASQVEYRFCVTALSLAICSGVLIFYCHTIITIAFVSAPVLGWVLAAGFNMPALIPFAIDQSFNIAKSVGSKTDWIVKKLFPENSSIPRPVRRVVLPLFTLLVAATLPLWGLFVAIRNNLNQGESYSVSHMEPFDSQRNVSPCPTGTGVDARTEVDAGAGVDAQAEVEVDAQAKNNTWT